MTIEQAKDELYRLKSDIRTGYPLRTNHQKERFMQSIDKAVKSLDMWNKFSDEIEELLDKRYCEIENKVQDNLAEGIFQSEKAIKRRIKEIKKEIEE